MGRRCRADPQLCSLVAWFPTPWSWGHESSSFLHRAGLALSGFWPASRIQKRAGGEAPRMGGVGAGAQAGGCGPEPILLAVPGIWPDPGSESGPKHVGGPGPLPARELRHLPEPTHPQGPRPGHAPTHTCSLLWVSPWKLGCGGGQAWPLSLGSCSLPKGTIFLLGKPSRRQAQASMAPLEQRTQPHACSPGTLGLGEIRSSPVLDFQLGWGRSWHLPPQR